MKNEFETKDSGARAALANGMVRDTEDGKIDYSLAYDGPMFDRFSALLTRGAAKYQPRNWMLALESTDRAEREKTKARFIRSACRHWRQWLRGDRDEDHAAAVFFNVNCYEAMLETDHIAATVAVEAPSVDALTAGKNHMPGEMVQTWFETIAGSPSNAAPQTFALEPHPVTCNLRGAYGGPIGGLAADLTPGLADVAAEEYKAKMSEVDADAHGMYRDRSGAV